VRTRKRLRESVYLCVFVCFASNPVLAKVCVHMRERDRNNMRARERAKESERDSMCEFVCV